MTFQIPRPEWVSDALVEDRGEHAGFQMYSRAGNDAVATMVYTTLARQINERLTRAETISDLQDRVRTLAHAFPEVHDTEPEWAIVDAVNAYFDTQGWVHVGRDDLS